MTGVGLLILLVLVLSVLWVHLAPDLFRLPDRPVPLTLRTADGWTLQVFHRPAPVRRFVEPVVLCPGLATNHAMLEFERPSSLAWALADAGFEVYTVDLRGAEGSQSPDWGPCDATFDDYVHSDVPALLSLVRERSGSAQVLWLGHSLGGLVGLAGASLAGDAFKAVVTVGAPVFFHYRRRVEWMLRLARWLAPSGRFPLHWFARLGTPLAAAYDVELAHASANLHNIEPRALRRLLANAFSPIWSGVLGQLEDWVRNDAFRSVDGAVDYREGVRRLTLPVLVLGGSADNLAPPSAVRAYFEALQTVDKQLRIFGKGSGGALEYGHGDLVIGKNVAAEVYPVIVAWLIARATPSRERAQRPMQGEAGRGTEETSAVRVASAP